MSQYSEGDQRLHGSSRGHGARERVCGDWGTEGTLSEGCGQAAADGVTKITVASTYGAPAVVLTDLVSGLCEDRDAERLQDERRGVRSF